MRNPVTPVAKHVCKICQDSRRTETVEIRDGEVVEICRTCINAILRHPVVGVERR